MATTRCLYHGGAGEVERGEPIGGGAAEMVAQLRRRWQEFAETVCRPEECVYCSHKVVWWNGSRTRTATVLVAGIVAYLTGVRCRRVRCGSKECGRSWTLRPEGMVPRRHFQLPLVAEATAAYVLRDESTQEELAVRYGCSRWTIGRWVRWVGDVADPSEVARLVLKASGEPVLPKVEVVLRRGLEMTREVIRRAGENLALLEALASAEGREPPGLASVVERVVRGLDRVTTYASPALPELSQ